MMMMEKAPWHDEDAATFFDDSGDGDDQQQVLPPATHHHHHHQQQQIIMAPAASSKGWNCGICTYLNENETFLSCEMCGSCRPKSPISLPTTTTATTTTSKPRQQHHHHHHHVVVEAPPQKAPVRRQGSFSNHSQQSCNSEKKETRFTDILARHMGRYETLQASSSASGQQQPGGNNKGESEADLELAMIYAQQERMLAEFQSGRS
jgi:hypothetical protein